MNANTPPRILFVCTGNICRSPTAEGVARAVFAREGFRAEFDSAGTQGYHSGEAPDPRSQKAATRRGYDLSGLRARKLTPADFARFDLVLAMDQGHMDLLQAQCPAAYRHKVRLFLDHASGAEVPDPYYGGDAGFEHVLDLCEDGAHDLLAALRKLA
ncbi:low molecular weight protein-tyrosine-phosphatase [Niveibacterium sp. SC-1]|uniref:low molecular weight protein-tyrosine-phosphatase n=1 Tax=Niveibacterium sp. SC-1 TaxID=3135646 RepID=UPI00311F14F7